MTLRKQKKTSVFGQKCKKLELEIQQQKKAFQTKYKQLEKKVSNQQKQINRFNKKAMNSRRPSW